MDQTEKLALIAELLEIDAQNLNADTNLEEIDSWDSMAALSLIVMMEEKFGRTDIDGKTIKSLKRVADIMNLMEN